MIISLQILEFTKSPRVMFMGLVGLRRSRFAFGPNCRLIRVKRFQMDLVEYAELCLTRGIEISRSKALAPEAVTAGFGASSQLGSTKAENDLSWGENPDVSCAHQDQTIHL